MWNFIYLKPSVIAIVGHAVGRDAFLDHKMIVPLSELVSLKKNFVYFTVPEKCPSCPQRVFFYSVCEPSGAPWPPPPPKKKKQKT